MAIRSARLEQVLGARVDNVTASHLHDLITNRVAEAFDLDFKRDMYGASDASKRDLATDVAALANTAGGLIIIGIAEDAQARAAAFHPVGLLDAEIARIRQIVGSLVAPVPTIDVYLVPSPDHADVEAPADGAIGFMMIAVARSLAAPHAVLVNDSLRYPARNGSTTRYLSEPEVAEAYRARLAGLGSQVARLDAVWTDGLARLDTTETVWAAVALAPELAGSMRITQAAYRAFQMRMQNQRQLISSSSVSIQRCSVGPGVLHADGSMDHAAVLSTWVSIDLHTDGSGFFAVIAGQPSTAFGRSETLALVDDEALVAAVLSALVKLGHHAQDGTGAGGSAVLRAGIWKPTPDVPVQLAHSRGMMGGRYGPGPLTTPRDPVQTVAPIDALTPGPLLVAAAARLCEQLGNAFGAPELGQLSEDGQLRRRYLSAESRALEAWANSAGVEVVDETIAD